MTVCVDDAEDHNTILQKRADHMADWVASIALGGPAPAACAKDDTAVPGPCATPPPND
jgi:hypothetical protein